ncbi:MAG: RNA methyltransferase [Spirochaetaceae bacterium]|nr:RNA methyltransferase [Spirochaetaceae bacterium]
MRSPAANGCGLGGQPEPAPATPALRSALVQALPKGPRMDLIIRQAVEAGVADIFPLNSRHCIARERSGQEMAEKRLRRERIVRSALQQSGSALMTRIHETTDPESLFHILAAEGYDPDGSLYLLCHELPIPGKSIHENCAGNPKSVVLLIGPEGGFSPEEIEFFIRNGCALIHFEGPVLRTETAALYAVAAIKTILMERASWKLSR